MQNTYYPFFVQLHLTEKCNLSCHHCYQNSISDEMSYEDVIHAINSIASTIHCWVSHYSMEMTPSIHFTGGEPLLREDIFDLLRYARSKGFSTSLLSNGTLINNKIARRLKDVDVRDVQVSIDGLEEVHDTIRGSGAFRKALSGILYLVIEGIETNINVTVSSLNYFEIDSLVRLAGKLGVNTVGFSRLVPCGKGKKLSEYLLTPKQLTNLSEKLLQSKNVNGVSLVSRDPLINLPDDVDSISIPQLEFPLGGCAAGIFGVTITADGTIMPCRRMDLAIGNIKTDNFRQLWAESQVLTSLRNRHCYHGNCRTCQYWPICRGCRAISYAISRSHGTEDFLGQDPQCARYRPTKDLIRSISSES
jgi:AdoMet-dependent heme synthase